MRFDTRPFRGLVLSGVCCAAVLLGAGCARVYDVKVDAMQNPEIQSGHSYRLNAKNPGRAASDPNYERAIGMVRKALAGHGMYEADRPEDAEVAVEIAYEVGPRRVVAQEVDPLVAGVGSPMLPSDRRVVRDAYGNPVRTTDSSAVVLREVYEKKLTIVAREGRPSDDGKERPPRELWRVEVKVDDESDSVDSVLPVLVGAAVDHIGTDSASQQTKRVAEDSEPVNFVKEGS